MFSVVSFASDREEDGHFPDTPRDANDHVAMHALPMLDHPIEQRLRFPPDRVVSALSRAGGL